MNRWRLALLATVAVLALGGCLRFDADLTVDPDNTVSGTYVVAVKEGTGDTYGMSDKEMAQELWSEYSKANALSDASVGDFDEEGYVGVKVSFADEPLDTFSPSAEDWGIERVGDVFVVSGPSNGIAQAAPDDVANDDLTAALADAKFTVSVTFPGEVIESNGTVDHRTVTWQLQEAPPELSARGSAIVPPDRASPLAWFAVAVLLAGGIAYAAVGRLTRHKR